MVFITPIQFDVLIDYNWTIWCMALGKDATLYYSPKAAVTLQKLQATGVNTLETATPPHTAALPDF